jgi:hypothetical protein
MWCYYLIVVYNMQNILLYVYLLFFVYTLFSFYIYVCHCYVSFYSVGLLECHFLLWALCVCFRFCIFVGGEDTMYQFEKLESCLKMAKYDRNKKTPWL